MTTNAIPEPVARLLTALARRGIALRPDNGTLRATGPAGTISEADRLDLAAAKADLLGWLTRADAELRALEDLTRCDRARRLTQGSQARANVLANWIGVARGLRDRGDVPLFGVRDSMERLLDRWQAELS